MRNHFDFFTQAERVKSFLADERHPWYLYRALRSNPDWRPKKADFIFTMDVERGDDIRKVPGVVRRVNDILSSYGPGTYFLDAELVERNFLIDAAQHEIATHGYYHTAMGNDWWMLDEDFITPPAQALAKATKLITGAYGKPVSFRSAKFSTSEKLWPLLKRQGYKYTSNTSPFSPRLFPHKVNGLKEFPLSRNPVPALFWKGPLPSARYTPLMITMLQEQGPKNFAALSGEILGHWQGQKHPYLMFIAHNWELREKDYVSMKRYLDELEKSVKLRFVPLRKYAKNSGA